MVCGGLGQDPVVGPPSCTQGGMRTLGSCPGTQPTWYAGGVQGAQAVALPPCALCLKGQR